MPVGPAQQKLMPRGCCLWKSGGFLERSREPRAEPHTAGSFTAPCWDLHPFFCMPPRGLGREGDG